MKKLHMGTVSYGFDSMDEVAHQLAMAFGASAEQSNAQLSTELFSNFLYGNGDRSQQTRLESYRYSIGNKRTQRYVISRARCGAQSRTMPQRTYSFI